MTIQVTQDQINAINEGFAQGGVRLPFPVLYLRWRNGKQELSDLKDARHFGGWEVDGEAVGEYLAMTGLSGLPHGFSAITAVPKSGGEYTAYVSRWIGFAPIGQRKRWRKNEQGRAYSHVQILGLVADFEPKKKVYSAWGNVVLTATGLSAQAIEDALQKFSAATAVSRQQHAPGVPAYFFWHPLGTFGEFQAKLVGKGNNRSPITPCQVHLPDQVGEDHLSKWFVGAESVEAMVALKRQADSWLSADSWKRGEEGEGGESGPENFPAEYDDHYQGDEVPF